ncbi:MarR family winged helix-turn-helix transcriptional regulator [Cryptosporangium sp. NPDC048952]|uniref:MarR family winged helix-turn-helix transcriptional regulator n=1 Tax=Cryptosporangium sp. NPDC048952 TaxID=3363961 RepID=UPI00371BE962
MSKQSERAALLEATATAAAEFGAAAAQVDAAASAILGVNRTDLRILGSLYGRKRLTAGEAAAAAGLSAAATSTAIQRLLAAGYVSRDPDPQDRRRAVLALTPPAHRILQRIYDPIGAAGRAALDTYTDAELSLVERFLTRGRELQLSHAERIHSLSTAMSTEAADRGTL